MRKKPLNILFLWHLHQPIYYIAKNSPFANGEESNHYILPWVRLHATKAYFDMAKMVEKYPEVGLTINITPSLISQLDDYTSGNYRDYYLDISLKEPHELNDMEKNFLIEKFFQANHDTVIKPFPGYSRLLALKKEKSLKAFHDNDLLDLQVWFNLAWFGFSARREFPQINDLIKKDHGFSQNDKEVLFDIQRNIIKSIIPLYNKISKESKTEISTTPFYHPILPLIINTDNAHRCMPQAPLPPRFSYPLDALNHIRLAKKLYKEKFGNYPVGFWPAEGSVSPEALDLFIKEGVQWIATDEEILWGSLRRKDRAALFQPHKYQNEEGEIAVFFRDKGISDSIGFKYSKMSAKSALEDFFLNLENIAKKEENSLLTIILDGENPWEYYRDGGESFLDGLYSNLIKRKNIQPLSMREAREINKDPKVLQSLFTGSWIYGNFAIWISSEEDNLAWIYLLKTRKMIQDEIEKQGETPEIKKALANIYIAEGSDWFWWYGDDFRSESKKDFDRLFRSFLMASWKSLNKTIPFWLMESVFKKEKDILTVPLEFINPKIDGILSHYYEWLGSIVYETGKAGSAMFNSQGLIKRIAYGFNMENFFLKVEFFNDELPTALVAPDSGQWFCKVICKTNRTHSKKESVRSEIKIPLVRGIAEISLERDKINNLDTQKAVAGIADVVELKCSFQSLDATAGSIIEFAIELLENEVIKEKYPLGGFWKIEAPTVEFNAINWHV